MNELCSIWTSHTSIAWQDLRRERNALDQPPVALELSTVPATPTELATTVFHYQIVRSASVVGWVGDELLTRTRFGATSQLHRVHAPLNMRELLTFLQELVAGALLPSVEDAAQLICLKGTGRSESCQPRHMTLETRDTRLLVDGESRYTGLSYNNSGAQISYSSTEIDGRYTDL